MNSNSSIIEYFSNEFFDKRVGIYLAQFGDKIYIKLRGYPEKFYSIPGVSIKVIKKIYLGTCRGVRFRFFGDPGVEVRPCVRREILAYAIIPIGEEKIVLVNGSITLLKGEIKVDKEKFRINFIGEVKFIGINELVELLEPYLEKALK